MTGLVWEDVSTMCKYRFIVCVCVLFWCTCSVCMRECKCELFVLWLNSSVRQLPWKWCLELISEQMSTTLFYMTTRQKWINCLGITLVLLDFGRKTCVNLFNDVPLWDLADAVTWAPSETLQMGSARQTHRKAVLFPFHPVLLDFMVARAYER